MAQATNIGFGHFGSGNMEFHGPVTGQSIGAGDQRRTGDRPRADVGILTVIEEEMTAVVEVLRSMRGYETHRLGADGPLVHEALLPVGGDAIRLAATQTLDRGIRTSGLAFDRLVRRYEPAVVLLVGIAGGVRPDVRVGDVVISDQVIYYDARREAADGPHRRGQSHAVAAALGHRLNEFFSATGRQVEMPDGTRFQLFRGPIGSGEAVVTDVDSEIRRWLGAFHEKVLAVETEAAGVAQAFHEQPGGQTPVSGWLTIRGISDTADAAKGTRDHALAADRAAAAMRLLLPHLVFRRADGS
jgi:adenosylhomocysteine nucleosidase